jgi:putative DNA primase/helicase
MNVAATCNSGGAGKWTAEHPAFLRGADIVLVPDADEPGWKHANAVGASLVGIAARIRVLALPDLPAKGDVVDWLQAGGTREQLDALIEQAPEWQPPTVEEAAVSDESKAKATADEQKLIDELARLNAVDYDRRRNEAANQMGIRRGTLDDQVNARRAERADEAGPPPLFGHWVIEPWPEAVGTPTLISSLVDRIKRHVVLSDDEALTVALWIMFAWVHDAAAVHSPILLATSAEANSGKTQLLSLLGFLVPRALVCVEISEATLFRGIEKWQPTIIVDEADVILINNEPLRSVVNSGWTRGSCVPRCIGDDNTPHAFPTFCPKAIGMKGRKLPDTTLTRSIIIAMKRKKTSEAVVHFRSIDDAGLVELRRRALRWANDNGEKLDGAEPDMPPGFDNRLGDNWALLLAIAAHAGGEWPPKARRAAIKLSKVDDVTSIGVQALAAIKVAFDGQQEGFEEDYTHLEPLERISSADLAATLGADMTGPWAEWKNGKPITQVQLARVLKPFGIAPEVIWLKGGGTPRGYKRSQFEDAWERYL